MARRVTTGPLLAALVVAVAMTGGRHYMMAKIDAIYERHNTVVTDQMEIIHRQQDTIRELESEIRLYELRLEEALRQLEDFQRWEPVEVEVTGYAPLDPDAVEGVCYSGDPAVAASGAPAQPGVSIAAGPGVEFGTEIYVPGYGVGVVHDRGGMIGDNHIDLMFATREQALAWGRQKMTVWVKKGGII